MFRQQCGRDYYSSRMLSHFLLNCQSGLKIAQIARLVEISSPTASKQQGLSSKVLDFIHQTWSARVSTVRGTPGDWELRDSAVPLVKQVLHCSRPRSLHALFDAGAGKSDAGVRALWDLAAEHRNLDITLRACRYPHRLRAWKQLPSGPFVAHKEPGVCVGAPPKEIRLAETKTVLKGESAEQAIRTIICRDVRPGPKKDRWQPLYTTSVGDHCNPHTVVLQPGADT